MNRQNKQLSEQRGVGGAGVCSWGASNSTSLHVDLSQVGSEQERHPFFLYFHWQHQPSRHLALKPYLSSPPKAVNCSAWLIPLCNALYVGLPQFYYSPSRSSYQPILTRARPSHLIFWIPAFPGEVSSIFSSSSWSSFDHITAQFANSPCSPCLPIMHLIIWNLQQELLSSDSLLSDHHLSKCHPLQEAFLSQGGGICSDSQMHLKKCTEQVCDSCVETLLPCWAVSMVWQDWGWWTVS